MNRVNDSDVALIEKHREIWAHRPELRAVYQEWFEKLLHAAGETHPIVEIGSGPGFLKESYPHVLSADVIHNPWLDFVCDGSRLPFQNGSIGAIVMLDVLHHLPKPLDFMYETARVLRPGGRLVMIEPWITALSYLLYRFLHHEQCSFQLEISQPFQEEKNALDGNAAIPFILLKHLSNCNMSLQLIERKIFIGLPYLATLGFKSSRAIPITLINFAKAMEWTMQPFRRVAATRIFAVWENFGG
jgi:SAM-dependent methyltransferase